MTRNLSTRFREVDLRNQLEKVGPLEWLSAIVPTREGSPLVSMTYALNGEEQPFGLRLDLGKRVFIDRPDDGDLSNRVNGAVPQIIDVLLKSAA
jgi:hypothetical protein